MLAFTATWAAPADSPRAAAQTRVGCISTPAEYLIASVQNNAQDLSIGLGRRTFSNGRLIVVR
jgi:hypothetical protein